MKIIESIIEKESLYTKRIEGNISTYVGGGYEFITSLDKSSTLSACTLFDDTNPSYQIYFPYDTFYAEKLNYSLKDTRYPKAIKIQGINEKKIN